jgi:sensor histidine kinase regulating citrate/malate metabolism
MSNEETQSTPAARPPRMIRLKVAAWIVIVLIVALVVVWLAKTMECRGALEAQAKRSAQNLATAIAAFGNRDIRARSYSDLQIYSDDLVPNKPIAFIAIIDSRGRVVVHTNREFLGKRASDLPPPRGVAEASAKVMGVTQQAGTVLVGVRLK